MKFGFVDEHRKVWPVRLMCAVLGLSASGYYAWRGRPESRRAAANRALLDDIRLIHAESSGTYGSPRVHAILRGHGRRVGRCRIERLMRRAGLRGLAALPRRTRTTDSRHGYAHWRRKIFDLHEAQPTATTTGFMARIQQIYRIEEEIRGLPAAERLEIRRMRSRPLVKELGRFAKQQRALMSPRYETATALNYGIKRWRAFNRFLYNGTLEIDNMIAERSIRGIAIGRRNWLFAGSEEGGKRAAKILSIIETCKACGVEPEAYLANVMEKIADDWPASRWDELMPWNWAPKSDDKVELAA